MKPSAAKIVTTTTEEESQERTHSPNRLGNQQNTVIEDFDSVEEDDDDDILLMTTQYQGDGRKREAKRHKSRAVVTQDEVELEEAIKNYQNSNPKILELEEKLDELKTLKINKRDL